MAVQDVARAVALPVTAGSIIDQTGGVLTFGKLSHDLGLKLTPGFIKRNPCDNARIILELSHDLRPLFIIIGFGLCRCRPVGPFVEFARTVRPVVFAIVGKARHVLPDQDAHFVTSAVPGRRLDFDVLADHVESELLGDLEIVAHRLVGRGGIKAVRPPALVQWTILEKDAVVERHPLVSVGIFLDGNLPESGVSFHFVHDLSIADQFHPDIIEERILR